jgi:hypothetical protein
MLYNNHYYHFNKRKNMNKTVLSAAIIAASFTANAVDVDGSVEYVMSSDNGVLDIKSDDTYMSFTAREDLGNGVSAYATLSLDVDSEAGTKIINRDALVSVKVGGVNIAAGRMANVQKDLSGATVDIFEGNGQALTGASRVDNAIKTEVDMGSVKLASSVVIDGATGQEAADSYDVGAAIDLGAVSVGGVFAENRVTNATSKMVAGSAVVGAAAVGASFERAVVDTVNVVASIDVGANTIKAGYADVEAGADTVTLEGVHNYSNNTSAYVNVQSVDTAPNEVYQAGLKHTF